MEPFILNFENGLSVEKAIKFIGKAIKIIRKAWIIEVS